MVIDSNLELRALVTQSRLVAIIRGDDIDSTVQAAKILYKSGIKVLEIALTLKNADEAIRQIASIVPAGSVLGAGTVLTELQVEVAMGAGASFIVTPGISRSIKFAVSNNVGVLAGAFTPTEIHQVLELGVAAVKLFPASVLGPAYVRSLREPFPGAPIIPVGGMSIGILDDYFTAGAVAVGVGGPLLGDAAKSTGNFLGLKERAMSYVQAVLR